MGKTALIIGATGLVGKKLTQQLLDDTYFTSVKAFGRSSTGINHPKLEEIQTDFNELQHVQAHIEGDVLFSCLGTTRIAAGSKDAQYKVDYTFQYEFAKLAAANDVPDYVLISSPGADPESMFFYSRIKGKLDRDTRQLPFRRQIYVQPSILRGDREKSRFGEQLAGNVIDGLSTIIPPLRKYHSITDENVAKAMIRLYKDSSAQGIYALADLREKSAD